MSWHFLQEQAEESWEGHCLDGAPSRLLKLIPFAGESCSQDNETDACPSSPSGMTCPPSMADHGVDTSTSSPEGSRAKTLAQQEQALAFRAKGQGSGRKWRGYAARLCRDTFTWKIAQCSQDVGLTEFSWIWPQWGMMRDGVCYPQPILAHSTSASASGFWPTPTVYGNHNRKGGSKYSGDGLATAVRKWPTPTVQDAKNNGGPSQHRRNSLPLNAEVGGPLNPQWVEWLMGWPIGWTDLKPLEMDRFQEWRRQHS